MLQDLWDLLEIAVDFFLVMDIDSPDSKTKKWMQRLYRCGMGLLFLLAGCLMIVCIVVGIDAFCRGNGSMGVKIFLAAMLFFAIACLLLWKLFSMRK